MSKKRIRGDHAVYHVMWRSINKQIIFHEKKDYYTFLSAVRYSQKILDYDLIAYCIMGNHVHLMIKEGADNISKIMQVIGSAFVRHYNEYKGRMGPLFQARFKSESIETQQYFVRCIRYICMNPVKAGLTKSVDEYKYSSFNEMVHPKKSNLINVEIIEKVVSVSTVASLCKKQYNEEIIFMDVDNDTEKKEHETKLLINRLGYSSEADMHTLPDGTKIVLANKMAELDIPKYKIATLLGIPRYKVNIFLQTCPRDDS